MQRGDGAHVRTVLRRRFGLRRWRIRNFRREMERVTLHAAIFLHADKRALSTAEILLDDERGRAAKGDMQRVTVAGGVQIWRRNAGRIIAELIVRARHRVDMARRRSGDEVKKIERVATAVFHNKGDGVVHFLFVYVAVFVYGREGGDRKLLDLATALPSWSFKRIVMLSGKKSV